MQANTLQTQVSISRFDPQPYTQLAEVHRSNGNIDAANKVLIAREDASYASRGAIGAIVGAFLKFTIGYGHEPLRAIASIATGWQARIERCSARAFPALQRPRSRGRLTLHSTSPDDQPTVQLNYFADPQDMRRMLDGMRCNGGGGSVLLRSRC